MTRRVTIWSFMFSQISDCTLKGLHVLWNGLLANWPDVRGHTLFIWWLNWLLTYFSVSLEINGKLLTGLRLGKQVQSLAFSGEVWLERFFHSSWKYPIWRICLLREVENRGIPSRAMLELGHCWTVYLMMVLSVFWHHPLSGVGKKGTYLLLSLAPLESWLV